MSSLFVSTTSEYTVFATRYTMTQSTALSILKLGHVTFLTGAAGSGKSYVLREYISYLRKHGIGYAVTASTGIASTHINGTTIQEQTRQCLLNISAILDEAGSSLDKIVSVTVVLADEDDFPGMNEEWLKWFPSNPPARQGAKLPVRIPGLKVSIAAIAEA